MNYLDNIAKNFTTLNGINKRSILSQYKTMKKYFVGKKCLELGCADGMMTSILINDFEELTVIDGSSIAIERLKNNIKSDKLNIIQGLFENIELDDKFDTIIMGHILEHVDNPISLLRKYANYLSKSGQIIISVPNAKSFHRIAGVKLGLLNSIYDLNENDIKIGHKRVYDFEKLEQDILNAGLKIICKDAYWLKFLSNKQIEDYFDEKLIGVYMELGSDFIENAAEIIVVCSNF